MKRVNSKFHRACAFRFGGLRARTVDDTNPASYTKTVGIVVVVMVYRISWVAQDSIINRRVYWFMGFGIQGVGIQGFGAGLVS